MHRYAIKALKTSAVFGGSGSTAYAYTHYKPVDIVWDLDHTLIHTIKVDANNSNNLPPPDFIMGTSSSVAGRYCYVRPGAYYMVKFFSVFGGNQYVFTAATKDYANGVIEGAGIKHMIVDTIAREDVPIQSKHIEEHFIAKLQADITKYSNANTHKLNEWGKELVDTITKGESSSINPELLHKIASNKVKKLSQSRAKLLTIKLCGKDVALLHPSDRFILIDDNIKSHKNHEDTGILIPRYNADKKPDDYTLLGVAWIIFKCFFTEDIKNVVGATVYSVNAKK